MKVKLSDIATQLGISVAAVSMAINNKKGVSESTREIVLQCAEELGYKVPQYKETNIVEKKNNQYIKLIRVKKHGMVMMDTAFFTQLIEGVEKQARKEGYEFLVANVDYISNDENLLMEEYYEDIAGMIVLSTEITDKDLIGVKLPLCPLVFLDSRYTLNKDTILMNNRKAIQQAFEYCYNHGHRNIGYLKSNVGIYNFEQRYKSYKECMEEYGLEVTPKWTFSSNPTTESAYENMRQFLLEWKDVELPTVLLADNDIIALGAIKALQEQEINIPQRVSVVGIDDMPFCSYVTPKMTTVKIFKEGIGYEAVKMLIEQIEYPRKYTKTVLVDTELIIRESTSSMKTYSNE